ncbi:MAG: SPOR domain-containing protein [Desulfovibrio sp.]
MTGPRLFTRTHLLALAALLLLPACSPRKPIPSDPPEVRTEAQVRGAARAAAQPAAAPQAALAEHKAVALKEPEGKPAEATTAEAKEPEVLVARVQETTAPAQAAPAQSKPAEAVPAMPKAEAAAAQAQAVTVETAKAVDAKVVEVKAAEVKADAAAAAKPAPLAKTGADSASKVAQDTQTIISEVTGSAEVAAQPEMDVAKKAATEAARPAIVQIASFNTEKNAQGALAWLKEKGYSESRVVRVEQGLTVYHRVQAGPFQDLDAARKALEELKVTWPQAFIPAD